MRRGINIRQNDISDCGVACLASISGYYGRKLPVQSLRMYSGTTSEGTTIRGLGEAAAVYGLSAGGFKGDSSSLERVPAPAILHLRRDGGLLHYVVFYGIRRGVARIMDPVPGKIVKVDLEQLKREWTGYLVIVRPGRDFIKSRSGTSCGLKAFRIVGKELSSFSAIIAASLVYVGLTFSISLFIKEILDRVLPGGNSMSMIIMTVVMAFVSVLSACSAWLRSCIASKLSVRTDQSLTTGYMSHLLRLPFPFFRSRSTGDLLSRMHDVARIRTMVTDLAINLSISAAAMVMSVILMFCLDQRMGLLVSLFFPIYTVIYYFYDRYNRIARREILEESSKFESSVVEGLRSYRIIKFFGLENQTADRISERMEQMNRRILNAACRGITLSGAGELCSSLMMVTILGAGSLFVIQGRMSAGELVSFYAIATLTASPLSSIIKFNSSVREGFSASERLYELMDMETEDFNSGKEVENSVQGIVFERVSFRYPGRGELLNSLSFEIDAGKITALCGESGCGKSTVVLLLLRAEKRCGGSIRFNGRDIDSINLRCWREIVSVVPQEPELFSGTIAENIACRDLSPDNEKITVLCREVGLEDFISSLPFGIYSRVGEGGLTLSRGQMQKISLARALYRNPEVLILDEASSSLDPSSAGMIRRLLTCYRDKGCAILMITHNSNELDIADRVLTLEGGEIRRVHTPGYIRRPDAEKH